MRAVLKGGLRESAAKGRARECTWRRSFPIPRTRAYVCVCTLRRLRNARTSFVLPRVLSHKATVRPAPLFLSFFFPLMSGETVGIRDMCVPIHTPRSCSAQERLGESLWCLEREPECWWKEDGRRREGWKDEGRGGKMTGTYAVHGRHKAANPWEYRACASGPARGLHELYGLSFSLSPPPSLSLRVPSSSNLRLLFARMTFRPAHGDFFFNTWLH